MVISVRSVTVKNIKEWLPLVTLALYSLKTELSGQVQLHIATIFHYQTYMIYVLLTTEIDAMVIGRHFVVLSILEAYIPIHLKPAPMVCMSYK